jgi:hypothetical protein
MKNTLRESMKAMTRLECTAIFMLGALPMIACTKEKKAEKAEVQFSPPTVKEKAPLRGEVTEARKKASPAPSARASLDEKTKQENNQNMPQDVTERGKGGGLMRISLGHNYIRQFRGMAETSVESEDLCKPDPLKRGEFCESHFYDGDPEPIVGCSDIEVAEEVEPKDTEKIEALHQRALKSDSCKPKPQVKRPVFNQS